MRVFPMIFSSDKNITLDDEQEELINELAENSFAVYTELKNHPYFLEYLSHVSPLRFYAETNIGSRPAKRGGGGRLHVERPEGHSFCGSMEPAKTERHGILWCGKCLQKDG